jgi:hypothetical protein
VGHPSWLAAENSLQRAKMLTPDVPLVFNEHLHWRT